MIWRTILLSMAAVLLCSCATARTGPDFAATSQSVGPPKAGNARIVLMREKAYAGVIDSGWTITLDGEPIGELKTGTFLYRDRPAGPHQLLVDQFPGVTRHDFA